MTGEEERWVWGETLGSLPKCLPLARNQSKLDIQNIFFPCLAPEWDWNPHSVILRDLGTRAIIYNLSVSTEGRRRIWIKAVGTWTTLLHEMQIPWWWLKLVSQMPFTTFLLIFSPERGDNYEYSLINKSFRKFSYFFTLSHLLAFILSISSTNVELCFSHFH